MPRFSFSIAIGLASCFTLAYAQPATESDENDASETADEAILVCARWNEESGRWEGFSPNVDGRTPECVTVTGTRINYDPTSRVEVLTAEEIEARGLSSAEEILRAIPQNFASINSFNNSQPVPSFFDQSFGTLGLGVATANLRGLGSRNTLLLVNGRRIGGVAGADDFVPNLRNIPTEAIERVEVLLDGGGAVYGSDAVGGVVNVITKSGYTGLNFSGRYEHSATGGDHRRLVGTYGFGWSKGNASITASHARRDPVNNRATGFWTRDYRQLFGADPKWNFVGASYPRSGIVSTRSQYGPWMILPPGNDGRNAAPEDFVPVTPDDYEDFVHRDAGATEQDTSVALAFDHRFDNLFAGALSLRGEVLWRESEAESENLRASTFPFLVPESNAFNNFGQRVVVRYDLAAERAAGLIPNPKTTSVREHQRYVLGMEYTWSDSSQLVVDHTFAVADGFRRGFNFGLVSAGATSVPERLNELRSSSDPNVAPNFFGDGSGQNPSIAEFFLPTAQDADRSYIRTTTAFWRGDLFDISGGPVVMVLGGEARREWFQDLDFSLEAEAGIGVAKPTRDLRAAFVELRVPLVGDDNARSGMRSLELSVKARLDKYETEGAVGSRAPDPDDPSSDIGLYRGMVSDIVTAKFSNVAPYLGLAWSPHDEVTLRVSRAEGFVAPRFRDMFARTRFEINNPFFFVHDPLRGFVRGAASRFTSNPDLNPEVSTTFSVGGEWRPAWSPGLRVNVDYSDVEIRDRIASNLELQTLLEPEIYGNLPQFFERDEDGNLLRATFTSVNISQRVSRALDVGVAKLFNGDFGEVLVELKYYRVLKQFDRAFADSEPLNLVGNSIGVDRFKAAFKFAWTRDRTTVSGFLTHTPSYSNTDHELTRTRNIPVTKVSSWTTLDLSVQHRFDNGVNVSVGGRDLLGRDFPFMLTRYGAPWDPKRVDLRGRVLFLDVRYAFFSMAR